MYSAMIMAAGSGSRTELGYNKIFYEIHSKSIIEYSVNRFLADSDFSEIIIVYAKDELEKIQSILKQPNLIFVEGGNSRQESVYLGLQRVTNAVVFIHDGARPNLGQDDLDRLKSKLFEADGLTLAIPVHDTVKRVKNDVIIGDIPREECYLIQTPQVFMTDAIKAAHEALKATNQSFSDDTSILMAYGNNRVQIVQGNRNNIKVTTKFDLILLEDLL